jgi:Raf kinase inhibitor-like YbhB/YbcL family protein
LPGATRRLTLTSAAFQDGAPIPTRYTCDGAGRSPPLAWSGIPRETKELALVAQDLDAARFVHWTVLGISPSETRLPEGRVPHGALETENGFGRHGWGGPCPPKGEAPHRYVFALYAESTRLKLGRDATPEEVRQRLAKDSIARGTLTGRFGR